MEIVNSLDPRLRAVGWIAIMWHVAAARVAGRTGRHPMATPEIIIVAPSSAELTMLLDAINDGWGCGMTPIETLVVWFPEVTLVVDKGYVEELTHHSMLATFGREITDMYKNRIN